MSARCLLYYITDRSQFPGDESARRRALLATVTEAARAGVDYIQLREKDLTARQLETLAREMVGVISELRTENRELRTRLLINSRSDIALTVVADGVHLRGDDLSAMDVRRIVEIANRKALIGPAGSVSASERRQVGPQGLKPASFAALCGTAEAVPSPIPGATSYQLLIAVSCHTAADVFRAASEGANFAVFAPVFEKREHPGAAPAGLAALRESCRAKIPVLALGGVTLENVPLCLEAGAAGIAAIRLFQENRVEEVVRALR